MRKTLIFNWDNDKYICDKCEFVKRCGIIENGYDSEKITDAIIKDDLI